MTPLKDWIKKPWLIFKLLVEVWLTGDSSMKAPVHQILWDDIVNSRINLDLLILEKVVANLLKSIRTYIR